MNLINPQVRRNDGVGGPGAASETMAGLPTGLGSASGEGKVHHQVYDALAEALIEGRIPPLKSVSLRSLAAELKVSPMPVREAVRRLIAEKALELQPSNQRLRVPDLTEARLRQLMQARGWVEPELARRAAGQVPRETLRRLREDNEAVMRALSSGDVSGYMRANTSFHFTVYGCARADLFYDMARSLWLQAGPFMRVVFGRLGTVSLPRGHYQDMIRALESGDGDAAHAAMAAEIREGMERMLNAGAAEAQPKVRKPKSPKP